MALTISNYQAAVDFIALTPNKSLVVTADGGLRQKSFADSLKSFGAFLVGNYSGNLHARNAAVADALVRLHAVSGSTSDTAPHSIPGFARYFQAKIHLQDRQVAVEARAASKVAKSALNQISSGKKITPSELGKRIFDTKPKHYQLDLGKEKTREILVGIMDLATDSDAVGRSIDAESGLAQQYLTDNGRQDNYFTGVDGQTVKTSSQAETIQSLKELAGNPAAAKALSCIANQAPILSLLANVSNSLREGVKVSPVINATKATQEHRLSKLANGNVQYQFHFYAPINGISSDRGDFVATEPWGKPYAANADEHDLHMSICVDLDANSLDDGCIEIVKYQPITFDINLKPETT